jgi:CheY-like chemotaxis protein
VSRKLLLADDSLTIQRVIELTFSGEDMQVVAVSDGEQAIARIPIEKPDIVLADIGMPKRSGYEVSAFVKTHPQLSHVPVLLLAGAFEPVDEARARQAQCDGVLVKPFEPQQVIARVRELVGRGTTRGVAAGGTGVPEPEPLAPSEQIESTGPREVADSRKTTPELSELAILDSQIPAASPGADTSLDEYFDRLDAAFATLGASSGGEDPRDMLDTHDIFGGRDVPTIDDVLGDSSLRTSFPQPTSFGRVAPPPVERPDATPTLAAATRPRAVVMRGDQNANAIADAFHLLFAIEQGEADTKTLRVGPPIPSVEISDELIDQITRRVLERLAPDAAKEVVAEVVSDVAERLVREEIERIRTRS